MKKLKAIFGSKNNKQEGDEDVDMVSSSSTEPVKENNCSTKQVVLPNDLWIHIGTFLEAKHINNIAQCSSSYHLLFFGQPAPKRYLSEYSPFVIDSEKFLLKDKDVLEREEFAQVQELIWRQLVVLYFPKFHIDLQIKNWLVLLKRRMRMIIKDQSHLLPMKRSYKFDLLNDPRFVENCSFIYKCPMDFAEMESIGSDERYCVVCESSVYRVDTAEDMEKRRILGHCVYFSMPPPPPLNVDFFPTMMMMGGPPPPMNYVPPPSIVPPPQISTPKPPSVISSSSTSNIPPPPQISTPPPKPPTMYSPQNLPPGVPPPYQGSSTRHLIPTSSPPALK